MVKGDQYFVNLNY